MPLDLTALRHAQLFELLRQENLSESTSARLRAHRFARSELDQEEAVCVQMQAVQSWGCPAA